MAQYSILKQATDLLQPQREKTWYEEMEEEVCGICPAMTYTQRLMGCGTCMAFGFLLSMGSLLRLMQLIAGNPTPFATMYTIGNIVSLCSTCFLFGPWTQFKKMFAWTRIVATCAYFFFMGMTLFLAFYTGDIPGRAALLLVCILCQFLALIYYTASFIPFAREMIKSCCKRMCLGSMCEGEDDGSMW